MTEEEMGVLEFLAHGDFGTDFRFKASEIIDSRKEAAAAEGLRRIHLDHIDKVMEDVRGGAR